MFCNNCGIEIANGNKFCGKCGTLVDEPTENIKNETLSESNDNTIISDNSNKSFLSKLKDGDFGLAKTYWLYVFLVNVIVNFVMDSIEPIGLILLIFIPYAVYSVFAMMGVWRASNTYRGAKVWAVLAKIITILSILVWLLAIVGLVSMIA